MCLWKRMISDEVINRPNYAALTDWCHLLSHCVTQEDWWAIHNYLAIIQEGFKRFFGWKRYSSKTSQVFGYVLQIIVGSFVSFAMIFQTCYSIYIRYKFWCWLQSHLQQDLTRILKLASWLSSNAIVLDWEVCISGQSNQTQCCQQLATTATFLQKELCFPSQMWGDFLRVTYFGIIWVSWKIWCQNLATYKLATEALFFCWLFFAFSKIYNVVKPCCESDYCKWDIVALARKYFISLCC